MIKSLCVFFNRYGRDVFRYSFFWSFWLSMMLSFHFAEGFEYSIYPALSEARYQKAESQLMAFRPFQVFAIGLDWNEFSFLLEKSRSDEKSGNVTLSTRLEQTSYTGYGRWLAYRRIASEKYELQFLPTIGIGAHQDKVVTEFLGQSTTESSTWEPLLALGLAARSRLNFFVFEIEGKLLTGKFLDPTLTFAGVLRVGLIF